MMRGVRTPLGERHDEELVALARAGDEQAFAELYRRYFQGLYDFALRMVRDREAAADVVQATFVKAWATLRGQKGVENVKAWLYAVARNLSIDELRRRQRLASPRSEEHEDPIYTLVDERRISDPSIAAHDRELVGLVWESAAALSPQEYSLLDMHLRQGLDADELAAALGVAKGAIYTRLTRLRDSLDEAVTSAVLMRRGRRECDELDALVGRMGARKVTRDVRQAINKHVEDCDVCRETKRRLITPAELFAGLTLVPVPDGLADTIWERIGSQLGFSGAGAHAAHGHDGGSGVGTWTVTKAKALTVLGTLGAVGIVGVLLVPRAGTIHDPSDVHSTTHRVAAASVVPVIQMAWTREADADAYSVSWTHAPSSEPDAVADLPGNSTGVTSPVLGGGRWWFHLRTRGHDSWTHTVHVGPFVVVRSTTKAPPISLNGVRARQRAARRHTAKPTLPATALTTAALGASSAAAGRGGVAAASTLPGVAQAATPGTTASASPGGSGSTLPVEPPTPPPDSVPPGSTPGTRRTTTTTPATSTTTTTTTTTTTARTPTPPAQQPVGKPAPEAPALTPDDEPCRVHNPSGHRAHKKCCKPPPGERRVGSCRHKCGPPRQGADDRCCKPPGERGVGSCRHKCGPPRQGADDRCCKPPGERGVGSCRDKCGPPGQGADERCCKPPADGRSVESCRERAAHP
jgi:RNA polymerase sigma factor (sigma-70 family)